MAPASRKFSNVVVLLKFDREISLRRDPCPGFCYQHGSSWRNESWGFLLSSLQTAVMAVLLM